jgi:hypothetical protein
MQDADEIGNDLVVAAEIHDGAQIFGVAAEAGDILAKAQKQTAGRALVVVECVVGQAVTGERGQITAEGKFLADRKRRDVFIKAAETGAAVMQLYWLPIAASAK